MCCVRITLISQRHRAYIKADSLAPTMYAYVVQHLDVL